MTTEAHGGSAIAALRRFARPSPPVQRCALCAAPLTEGHPHLLEPRAHELACSCEACAALFADDGSTPRKRVVSRVQRLDGVRIDEAQWRAFGGPIGIAFLVREGPRERVVARFPSPAGLVETVIEPEQWSALVATNPVLETFELDVEALLVRRTGDAGQYYRVSIDHCYRLTGIIRAHWEGMGGGQAVWQQVEAWFAELQRAEGSR